MKAETEELVEKYKRLYVGTTKDGKPMYMKSLGYLTVSDCTIIAVQFAIDQLHEAGIVAGAQLDELNEMLKELEDAK
jgi:hypothetical protein